MLLFHTHKFQQVLYLAHTRYRLLHPSSWYVFNPVNAVPDSRAVRRRRTHHQRASRECLLIWWTGAWGNYPEIPDSSIRGLTPSDTQHRPRSFRAALSSRLAQAPHASKRVNEMRHWLLYTSVSLSFPLRRLWYNNRPLLTRHSGSSML